jgi:O-antigen/teichoic acid export membrane protein
MGKDPLGAYALALTFAAIPVDRLASILTRATSPVFASVQHDTSALRRYMLGITEAISLVAFPASIGLALVADDLIALIGRDKWAGAVWPLRVLALAAVVRALTPLFSRLLVATGQAKQAMQATLLATVVMPPLFFLASYHGITAVATVWLVVFPLVSGLYLLRQTLRTCQFAVTDYFRSLRPAILASLAMGVAVSLASVAIGEHAPLILRLGFRCGIGVVTYACFLVLMHGGRIREQVAQLRSLFR